MTLKVKVNDLHFPHQLRVSQDACLVHISVILAQIYDELSRGQAKFPRILSQNGQHDLEGQGQWPLFSIPTETIPWCMFGANLVIPAQICDELSCGQDKVYGRTDGRTDGQADRRRQRQYPFGLKGQRSPLNSPHKGPVTRKMFPFDDVIITRNNEFTKVKRERMEEIVNIKVYIYSRLYYYVSLKETCPPICMRWPSNCRRWCHGLKDWESESRIWKPNL